MAFVIHSQDADAPDSMDRPDQTAPYVRLDLVDGYSDLHSVCAFEHGPNKVGGGSSRRLAETPTLDRCPVRVATSEYSGSRGASTKSNELICVSFVRFPSRAIIRSRRWELQSDGPWAIMPGRPTSLKSSRTIQACLVMVMPRRSLGRTLRLTFRRGRVASCAANKATSRTSTAANGSLLPGALKFILASQPNIPPRPGRDVGEGQPRHKSAKHTIHIQQQKTLRNPFLI